MPRAELTISIPGDVWIGTVTRDHADAKVRVLAAMVDGEVGTGLLELSGSTVDGVLGALQERDEVSSITVLSQGQDKMLVQFETTDPLLLFPIMGSGVPLEMPFDIVGGNAHWTVTASRQHLSELGEQLEAFEIPFTVESVTHQVETNHLLTDRQESIVRAAVEHGYYDTPRRCSLTELADELGLAKSTASETLHRAEEKIVKQFVEQWLAPEARTDSA